MIDMRSDFLNLPTEEMWDAMRHAQFGWAVGRQDNSVLRLEAMAAKIMGKKAALFVPTGRMACLVTLMSHCRRGNQVVMEKDCHIAWAQEWGVAFVCGLYPRLIEGTEGRMKPEQVEKAITESRFGHAPTTDLVCLENTHNMSGGRAMTAHQTAEISEVAHRHNAKVFLDGCRIFYASAALGVKPAELAESVDTVVFSLIKGLCGPGGVMLCGSTEDIDAAWHALQRLGGHAFHRAAMLAAGGIVALETMVERLVDDIARAKRFARELASFDGIKSNADSVESNIVMVDISSTGLRSAEFLERLMTRGVQAHKFTDDVVRFTFHRQIGDREVEQALEAVSEVLIAIGN